MIERRHQYALTMLLLILCSTAAAQSGRRSTTGSPSTTATTPSVSGNKPAEKKPPPAPKVQLLVGIDSREVFANVPFYVYDTVLDNCIRRLGEAEVVIVTPGSNKMTRADAIKAGKEEATRWVVSLEIRSVYGEAGRQVKNGQDELYVDYTVIEPGTGKIKRSGQTHQHIYQNGRGGVTLPTRNGGVYSEYSIKQAAREAADRILAGFDITLLENKPL